MMRRFTPQSSGYGSVLVLSMVMTITMMVVSFTSAATTRTTAVDAFQQQQRRHHHYIHSHNAYHHAHSFSIKNRRTTTTTTTTTRTSQHPLFSTMPDRDLDGTSTTAAPAPSTKNADNDGHRQSKLLLDHVVSQHTSSSSSSSMTAISKKSKKIFQDLMPPPPEDQFIMTGDICVLFFYAFTTHNLNDFIVKNVLSDTTTTIQQAVKSLDPTGDVINLQAVPVWVETQYTASVDHALSVHAQESLLCHWGPLFSTEGLACVTLCSCWLVAGWIHRAFHFKNSVDCTTDQALSKVLETWLSMAVMLSALAVGTSIAVDHFLVGPHYDLPTLLLQQQRNLLLCGDITCNAVTTAGSSGQSLIGMLTKADGMFIVDSMSVLLAWRFMANKMLNMWL